MYSLIMQPGLPHLAVLSEQIAGEVKRRLPARLSRQCDHAVALALPPGYQTEPEPLGDALGWPGRRGAGGTRMRLPPS